MTGRSRFDFILEPVPAYDRKLQLLESQLEDKTDQFDEAKQECSRLSSENGNLESIVFIIFTTVLFNLTKGKSIFFWGRGLWFVKYFVAVVFGFVYLACDICVPFIHQYSIFFLSQKVFNG
jgi:hypothetical protein